MIRNGRLCIYQALFGASYSLYLLCSIVLRVLTCHQMPSVHHTKTTTQTRTIPTAKQARTNDSYRPYDSCRRSSQEVTPRVPMPITNLGKPFGDKSRRPLPPSRQKVGLPPSASSEGRTSATSPGNKKTKVVRAVNKKEQSQHSGRLEQDLSFRTGTAMYSDRSLSSVHEEAARTRRP